MLRVGVAGLGKAFQLMLPTLVRHSNVQLVAAADPRAEARARFAADFTAKTYASVEELCAEHAADAIYVATPHQYHAEHVTMAAAAGKHVLVEKPMALTLDECRAMIQAVRRAGVQMVIGHSHSFDTPIVKTREIIEGGTLGSLRMITAMNFTDFLYRPRRPEELRTESGGGVVFNQAPHHVDVMRYLAGGMTRSVRAMTGAWDQTRPTEGAYSALLTFESGAFASITYSGYAHFDSDEFMGWIAESGYPKDPDHYGTARALLRRASSIDDEMALKHARNYGGGEAPPAVQERRSHQQFGVIIASCERGDLRPVPNGVAIYDDVSRRFEAIADPAVPRAGVIDELYNAVFFGRTPLHNGEWGLATMEVCLGILQSAREQREIVLQHQTALLA
ncbi:MAG: phthalate 4,5-cis-dihydrodiol dehydrogenase [Alphaproteobacteria bacterium]|nr:phthalate 4,5-cis-dihydrodiol dehydrogenase [Alphaproteobacteria bacterium]